MVDFLGGGGSGDDFYILSPWDKPPASPHACNDEFSGASLDPKWSWINQGTSTAAIVRKRLRLTPQYNAADSNRILYQPSPAGDFTVSCKCRLTSPKINFVQAGLCLVSAGGQIIVWGHSGAAAGCSLNILRWTSATAFWDQTTFLTNDNVDHPVFTTTNQTRELMLRFVVNRTLGNIYAEVSEDGEYWYQPWSQALAAFLGNVDKIGVVSNHIVTPSSDVRGDFKWFRVNWTPDF